MAPLHALVTALIRIMGLYFGMRTLDHAASPLFMAMAHESMISNAHLSDSIIPWAPFLGMAGAYFLLTIVTFVAAPWLARVILGKSVEPQAQVPWSETLIVCTGVMIMAWAFVRLFDTIYNLMQPDIIGDQVALSDASLVYLFGTIVLLGTGFLVIAKCHRITAWISAKATKK